MGRFSSFMRNIHETNKRELFGFIKLIDEKLPHKITIIAIGGTALTLLNLKESTKDIDFDLPFEKDWKDLVSLFQKLDFEQEGFAWFTSLGLRIDLFKQGYIFSTQLPSDYVEKSNIAVKLENITLKTLSLEDMIITKLGRGDERDFMDLRQIYLPANNLPANNLHINIDNEQLVERFFEIARGWFDSPKIIKQKLLDLLEIKFLQWEFQISPELVQKVKSWKI